MHCRRQAKIFGCACRGRGHWQDGAVKLPRPTRIHVVRAKLEPTASGEHRHFPIRCQFLDGTRHTKSGLSIITLWPTQRTK